MNVLRDLPGVQRIEQMLKVREVVNEPGYETLLKAVDEVSVALFCITIEDTLWSEEAADEDPDGWDDYEDKFYNADEPYEEVRPFWEAIGWDVSNGRGSELPSAVWFERQIIAVESGLVAGARFTPDGSGTRYREPVDADQWGSQLQQMAGEWMKGR